LAGTSIFSFHDTGDSRRASTDARVPARPPEIHCKLRVSILLAELTEEAARVPGTALVDVYVRDPKDYIILSAVADADADVLVSSDQDLLILADYHGTLILTPRQFLSWLDETEPRSKA
jgi:hypothetical protein